MARTRELERDRLLDELLLRRGISGGPAQLANYSPPHTSPLPNLPATSPAIPPVWSPGQRPGSPNTPGRTPRRVSVVDRDEGVFAKGVATPPLGIDSPAMHPMHRKESVASTGSEDSDNMILKISSPRSPEQRANGKERRPLHSSDESIPVHRRGSLSGGHPNGGQPMMSAGGYPYGGVGGGVGMGSMSSPQGRRRSSTTTGARTMPVDGMPGGGMPGGILTMKSVRSIDRDNASCISMGFGNDEFSTIRKYLKSATPSEVGTDESGMFRNRGKKKIPFLPLYKRSLKEKIVPQIRSPITPLQQGNCESINEKTFFFPFYLPYQSYYFCLSSWHRAPVK